MIGDLAETGRRRLSQAAFELSSREANLLLGHVLHLTEAQVLARWDSEVEPAAARAFEGLVERRLRGEPVAYLVGSREFYGRDFRVDSRVLIPRPETEHLIEAVLALPLGDKAKILDLGTGSGCMAITLGLELPGATVVAGDLSVAALALASENARTLGARNVRMLGSDLASSVALEDFDLVVSNPPYVGLEEAPALSVEVRDYEPHLALFPPGNAESLIRRLVTELAALRPGAFLAFEIGHLQSGCVLEILSASSFSLLEVVADYQGIPRTVIAERT